MIFKVLPAGSRCPTQEANCAYLITDNWDDWFEFSTMYTLVYIDSSSSIRNIGSTKIGQLNMEKGQDRPKIPKVFNQLDEQFFSVGQDDSFYEALNDLGEGIRSEILSSLNDIALNEDIYKQAIKERVTNISLLRFVSITSVTGQFRRLARGDARLSRYSFTYNSPIMKHTKSERISLSFDVIPESNPPTNIHVLIGRNGVGKTHLIDNMINSLIDEKSTPAKVGEFIPDEGQDYGSLFSNVVSVTFSAFDETEPLAERKDKSKGIQFSYVGLKRIKTSSDTRSLSPKSPTILRNEFVRSLYFCIASGKIERWKRAVRKLESDPVFSDINITAILTKKDEDEDEFKLIAGRLFTNLSSGHKIVLLTITRLVETIEEKSLVFLDEPEAHLHPPLLSAFIRSLSDLLINRNAVSIIATHSPVVLQEVPKSCTWKLWRSGHLSKVERLEIESFGENVGVLTREVFGLENTDSGFHNLLNDAMNNYEDYESAMNSFKEQLGVEAKGILRALFIIKNNSI
ncbi:MULTISPECIES: AAA family ATPase [Providencia]|uniref:AAA family ATPase n=1 Tax=Providencia TaxID=586 RepID=UPI0012B63C52|nr:MULTISPECIES: AAA family ATPase [Providencia]MTC55279.1 AAA family ATPase [Providencia rustigianii]